MGYEAPKLDWNKPMYTSNRNSGYGMSSHGEYGILSNRPYSIDYAASTDVQKIEHTIRSMRTSVQLGNDYLDFRQIFQNFPLYGHQQMLAGHTTLLGSRIPM